MTIHDLDKLAALVNHEREALLSRCRQQVRQLPSARNLDIPPLNDRLPALLDELVAAFQSKSDQTISEAFWEGSSPVHELPRVRDGFDIEEVVAKYNILRGCIHDLADENGLNLQGKPFQILNGVLDGAIRLAVQTYTTQRALEVRRHCDEHLALVAHDFRTPLNAISLAATVLELTLPEQGSSTETTQMLQALRRNVEHLEGLVRKVIEETIDLQPEV